MDFYMSFEKSGSQNKENRERKKGFHEKLGRVSRHCGIFLLGALMEFAGTVQAQNFEEKGFVEKKEKTENNILYRSSRAEKSLKQYEHLYPNFKEIKQPIVVGSFEEELDKFGEGTRLSFDVRFKNVGAMAFPGYFMPEEARKKWQVGGDTIYIMYGTGLDQVPLGRRIGIPYHEGSHAKHFAEQLQRNPSDTTGYLRHPEIPIVVNRYLEELITGFETICWFEKQKSEGDGSALTKEEMEVLDQAVRKERDYFLDNYYHYYFSRYGANFEVPAGEFQSDDAVDSEVETMFRDGGILDALKAGAEEMRQGEK